MPSTQPSAPHLACAAHLLAKLITTMHVTPPSNLRFACAAHLFTQLLHTTVPHTAPSTHRLACAARLCAQLFDTYPTVPHTRPSPTHLACAARFGAFTAFPFLVLPRRCRRRGPVVAAGLAAPVFDLRLVAHASILVNTTSFSDEIVHFSHKHEQMISSSGLHSFIIISMESSKSRVHCGRTQQRESQGYRSLLEHSALTKRLRENRDGGTANSLEIRQIRTFFTLSSARGPALFMRAASIQISLASVFPRLTRPPVFFDAFDLPESQDARRRCFASHHVARGARRHFFPSTTRSLVYAPDLPGLYATEAVVEFRKTPQELAGHWLRLRLLLRPLLRPFVVKFLSHC